jgi:transcriptional regulator with XRE-family HTH domain
MLGEATEFLPGLAANLRRLIDGRGSSPAAVAAKAGVAEVRVRRFLGAEAEPTATELLCLAGALGVPMELLIEGITWQSDGKGGGRFRVEAPTPTSAS